MVALEQRLGRRSAQHAIELPCQVLGILQPGIGAAGAERRHLVRGIAGEDDAAVDELVHSPALEFVQRDPFEIELVVPEHAGDARPHVLRQLFDIGIGKAVELQVDAPDVVRLLVQQRRAAGMERRIEPEPALGRKRRRHPDVGDQELILEHLACEFRADQPAERGFGAVAGDHEAGADAVRTVGRLDRQQHMVVARLERGDLVAPAQVDGRQFLDAVDQIRLGVELLQVDESRPLVPLLRQQVELVELGIAVKDLADAPHHALVDHALADAEPVPEFERALGKADRPRALADAVGIVEQHDGLAALRQIDRQRQSHRACANDDDRMLGEIRTRPILIGMAAIAELDFGLRHAGFNPVTGKACDW